MKIRVTYEVDYPGPTTAEEGLAAAETFRLLTIDELHELVDAEEIPETPVARLLRVECALVAWKAVKVEGQVQ